MSLSIIVMSGLALTIPSWNNETKEARMNADVATARIFFLICYLFFWLFNVAPL